MKHTLIAVFDNRADAQSAMDELLLSGFAREVVRLTEEAGDLEQSRPAVAPGEESFGESIKHFFSDLFGSHTDVYSQKYSTAVNKGHHVLTVTAADEPEVERAADIVERFGPVDIDEKSAEWSGGAGLAGMETIRASGAGGMQQAQGASLHFQGDRTLFAQQSLNDERPMGYTYQESMGPGEELSVGRFGSAQGGGAAGSQQRDTSLGGGIESGGIGAGGAATPAPQAQQNAGIGEVQRGGVRVFFGLTATEAKMEADSYYRSHWDSTYSAGSTSYDDYEPAYSFGHEMAQMYRGQPWNDVEAGVRTNWEARNTTGVSTWEQFKAAIRHGWDRLTS
jgi:hypothetical protein